MTEFHCITTLAGSNNEQPVWIDSQQSLFWIDDTHQRLYQYHEPSQHIEYCEISAPILSLSPTVSNGFIATLKDGIGFFDMQSRKVTYISKPDPFATNSKAIAGIADKRGHFWSFSHPKTISSEKSKLYQLSPQMNMQRVAGENWLCTAPPAFSKDGKRLFQSCGSNRYIYVTDLDEQGQPLETESFCRISKSEGRPHGLCVDEENYLWVCHDGIGVVSRYSPDGERVERIRVAATGIKYCTFGGEHLDTLYLVTSSVDAPTQERKKIRFADAIISFKPGVKGLQVNRFAG